MNVDERGMKERVRMNCAHSTILGEAGGFGKNRSFAGAQDDDLGCSYI
jgi:hypothetical protein